MKLLRSLLCLLLLGLAVSAARAAEKPAYRSSILNAPADRWTGDLDGMVKRRMIRVLVPASRTFYHIDRGQERGIDADFFRAFEQQMNKELKTGKRPITVLFKPVRRDQLLEGLRLGRGDIAAGNLTITPEREALVDFSTPWFEGVREVVVTGPAAPALEKLDDLAAREITARRSSSYWASLEALGERLKAAGATPPTLDAAPEELEDEDILEMVQAGLLPLAVVDEHKARFWAEIFPDLRVRDDLVLREGGRIGWAIRQGSPQLAARLDRFAQTHAKGTLFGNTVFTRYLKDQSYVRSATAEAERRKFEELLEHFRLYGDRYGFDPLMLAAQGYQESRLDQSLRSRAGAIGVMQVTKATAKDKRVGITGIEKVEPNIEAGSKYMRILLDQYFPDLRDDTFNATMFAFAAYNAGPTRLARLRAAAPKAGLDPKVWFDNVELLVADEVGREPVEYVRNIFKYYVAYRLYARQLEARRAIEAGTD